MSENINNNNNNADHNNNINKEEDNSTPNDRNKKDNKHKKCDMCGYGHDHNGMILIECQDCHVTVHRDCYGMPTFTPKIFSCWACQSVGKTFHVHRQEDDDDQPKTSMAIRQTKRPTHCSLCGYSNDQNNSEEEVHAMHPVYDNYGNKARQLYYKTNTPEEYALVWAHTLCGFFLSTKNLMYAVSQEGVTHEGDEEDINDDRSVNPALMYESDEDEHDEEYDPFGGFAPTHHFVYYVKQKVVLNSKDEEDKNNNKEEKDTTGENSPTNTTTKNDDTIITYQHTQWSKRVQMHQEELQCEICQLDDTPAPGVFRIAVQCSAGDKDEFRHYRHLHTDLNLEKHETCTRSYHVGCARWGSASGGAVEGQQQQNNATANAEDQEKEAKDKEPTTNHRRVYYYPGLPDTREEQKVAKNVLNREPIRCLYCPDHAKDVDKDIREGRQITGDIKFEASRQKRKLAMAQKYGRAATLADMDSATAPTQKIDNTNKNNNKHAKLNNSKNYNSSNSQGNTNSKYTAALERVKKDLATKVVKISKDKGKSFAKEQKKLWKQRLCSPELGISQDEFQALWGEAKDYAFDVWQRLQQR